MRVRVLHGEALPRFEAKRADVADRLLISQELQIILLRGPNNLEDNIQLICIAGGKAGLPHLGLAVGTERKAGRPREERSSLHKGGHIRPEHPAELCDDAADAPHIDGLGVLGLEEDQLRRPVPPCDDVDGQGLLRGFLQSWTSLQAGLLRRSELCWLCRLH